VIPPISPGRIQIYKLPFSGHDYSTSTLKQTRNPRYKLSKYAQQIIIFPSRTFSTLALSPQSPPSLLSQAITPQIPPSQKHHYLNPTTTTTNIAQSLSNPHSLLLQNLIFRPNPPSGWLQHVVSAYISSAILPLSSPSSSPSPSQQESELTLCRTIVKLISDNAWKHLASSCMEEKDKEDVVSSSSSYFSTPRTLRLAAVARLILEHLQTESSEQRFITTSKEQPHAVEQPSNTKSTSSSRVSDIIVIKRPMIKRDVEILCLMVLVPDWSNLIARHNGRDYSERCTTAHRTMRIATSMGVLKEINKALGDAVHLAPDTVFSLPLNLLAEVCLRSYDFTSALVCEALKQQTATAAEGGNGGDDEQLNNSRIVIMHGIADKLEHSSSTRTFIKHHLEHKK